MWASVYGYTDPGSTVTVTVNHGGSEMVGTVASGTPLSGWSVSWLGVPSRPGDSVTAEVGGPGHRCHHPRLSTAAADAGLDRLSGHAPTGMSLSLGQGLQHEFTWRMDSKSAVADAAARMRRPTQPAGVNALSNLYVFPHVTAKADLYLYASPRFAVAHWAWNEVYGDANSGPRSPRNLPMAPCLLSFSKPFKPRLTARLLLGSIRHTVPGRPARAGSRGRA